MFEVAIYPPPLREGGMPELVNLPMLEVLPVLESLPTIGALPVLENHALNFLNSWKPFHPALFCQPVANRCISGRSCGREPSKPFRIFPTINWGLHAPATLTPERLACPLQRRPGVREVALPPQPSPSLTHLADCMKSTQRTQEAPRRMVQALLSATTMISAACSIPHAARRGSYRLMPTDISST